MYPFLIEWTVNGHVFRLPTYGFLLAVGFSTAYFVALRRAVKIDFDPKHIENIFLICVISSIVGARLFHVVFEEFTYYSANPTKIFAVWEGGYTFYGALLSCFLGIYIYGTLKKVRFLELVDIATPSTALGLFIGRLGCFFAGCCWGRPTSMPWGIKFPNPEAFTATHNLAVHPTQLYEAVVGLVIFILSEWRFKNRKYVGQVFLQGVSIYAVMRFAIEYFRGDDYRGFLFGGHISYSQLVSIAIIPFALVAMFMYSRKDENEKPH